MDVEQSVVEGSYFKTFQISKRKKRYLFEAVRHTNQLYVGMEAQFLFKDKEGYACIEGKLVEITQYCDGAVAFDVKFSDKTYIDG